MKIIKGIATGVVVIMILNFVAFSIVHIYTHGRMFGSATGMVLTFAKFPREAKAAFSELTAKVRNYQLEIDPAFGHVNSLDKDVYGLVSYYSENADSLDLKLMNFKSNSVEHQWKYKKENPAIEGLSTNHPLLLKDYSIIFKLEYVLYRLDSSSNLIWENDSLMFHHSSEVDHEGNIWSPSTISNGSLSLNTKVSVFGTDLYFRDDAITKVDPSTGKILYSKSVSEILMENNYSGLVYGAWSYDLIHLNDIEPVLEDSKYWRKGDVFLSCRNIHTVFLFRPSTGKIIWLRTGLWANQHDVDIMDSTTITVFNNNLNRNYFDVLHQEDQGGDKKSARKLHENINSNAIVVYHFTSDSVSQLATGLISREKIATQSQGIFTSLHNGLYFIEETDRGKFYIGDDDRTLLKLQLVSADSTFAYYPGWSRVYTQIPSKKNGD